MTTYTTCGTYTSFTPSSSSVSINDLLLGFKWGGGVGTSTTVTYSFPTASSFWDSSYATGEPYNAGYGVLSTAAQQGVQNALLAWSHVANINFQQVPDNYSVVGDIRVAYTSMSAYTYAYTYFYTGSYTNTPWQGDVWLNATQPYPAAADFTVGARGYKTLIHELGHAIGFDHSFNESDPTIPDTGLTSAQNTYKYTVMAYCDAPGHWDSGACSIYPTTPMLLDIAAAQYLYGANMSYNSGNTTYTYNQGSNYYETIWDGGGTDTIVYNSTVGGLIDLRAGNFSQLGNPITLSDGSVQYDNVAIAYGAVIENATGGSGSDFIYGNAVDNLLAGGAGNDVLYGMGGNDTMSGGDGNDAMWGNIGDDTVNGDAGNDVLYGMGGNDIVNGGDGNDLLFGNIGDDTISGGNGNDILYGNPGNDTLMGNAGDDIFYVDDAGDVVVENANEGTDTVISSITYTLGANVENLTLSGSSAIDGTGNALDNIITGNSAANTLTGGAGNDTYYVDNAGDTVVENAGEGTDTVISSITYTLGANLENLTLSGTSAIDGTGNALDNVIMGNSAANTLTGGAGNDTYYVDNAGDTVVENAGEGTDTVISSISYTLGANVENLTLSGSTFATGTGNELDNVITANNATYATLKGGAGNDTYYINSTALITEYSGEGTDTVVSSITYTLGFNVENLTLTGNSAINGSGNTLDNIIVGNSAANVLDGDLGNDTIDGGAGADTMKGGLGNDTYYVDNADDTVIEDTGFLGGSDTVIASITYTLGANVENLTLSGSSTINGSGNELSNIITGNSAANFILGAGGNDTISGNAGDDSIDGGVGSDTMSGGTGNDTFYVDDVGDVVVENSGEGTDTVISSITYTLGANLENLTLSGTSAIDGTGNALDNIITGNSAANTLTGGAGNDTYYVDNAGDIVVENVGEGTDTVISSITYTLGSNVENLTLSGTSAIDGTGNALDNVITGNSAANFIIGGGGNDTIDGGAGNDVLYGFGGDDTVNGGDGNDSIWGNIGNDTISGDAGNDVLYGMGGNDIVNGGDGDDLLFGNIGDDTVSGGNGNDTLYGNPGNDILTGGAGIDTFVFNAPLDAATNVDTVTDFTVGTDILAMDDTIFTMLTVGALAANEFAAGAGLSSGQSATDYFVYNTSTGDLYYDADGSGAGSSTLVAHLSSGLALSASDFQVV